MSSFFTALFHHREPSFTTETQRRCSAPLFPLTRRRARRGTLLYRLPAIPPSAAPRLMVGYSHSALRSSCRKRRAAFGGKSNHLDVCRQWLRLGPYRQCHRCKNCVLVE